jgi:hypothetical protein
LRQHRCHNIGLSFTSGVAHGKCLPAHAIGAKQFEPADPAELVVQPVQLNLGASSNASIEQEALQSVGSYGKQIGHLAEALELVIGKLNLLESKELSQSEKDTLRVFLGDVSAIRKIKDSHE